MATGEDQGWKFSERLEQCMVRYDTMIVSVSVRAVWSLS